MSRLRIQVVDDAGTATAELAATAAIRKLDPLRAALEAATTPAQVSLVDKKYQQLQAIARTLPKDLLRMNAIGRGRIDAMAKGDELLEAGGERRGTAPLKSRGGTSKPLPDGIDKKRSWLWRTIASVPAAKRAKFFAECDERDEEITTAGVLGFANGKPHVSHVMHNSGDNEWYSPAPYVEAARSVMRNIDLDPASSPAANKVVKAAKFYTADDNGLEHEWKGRVFMNPPYSTELIVPFIEKLVASVKDGAVPEAVVLVNNATETQWFARLSSVATCLCLPMGRLQFQHPTRPSAKPLQGQIVAYVGQHGARFVATFREFGTCWSATR